MRNRARGVMSRACPAPIFLAHGFPGRWWRTGDRREAGPEGRPFAFIGTLRAPRRLPGAPRDRDVVEEEKPNLPPVERVVPRRRDGGDRPEPRRLDRRARG